MARKLKSQRGQSAIEYALVAIVLLAIVVTAIAQPMKDTIRAVHNQAKTKGTANITVSVT